MLPLIIAVLPWGVLVGAYGIESGLKAMQTQAMSLLVFAGTSQLVAMGMLQAGASLFSILVTTLLITARHLLYSMAMRQHIQQLPLKWRSALGFLLTDELFVNGTQDNGIFNRWYALGGGLSFYIAWNLATLLGIVAGEALPNLTNLGLDFAVVATFIAILIPMIKNLSYLVCVGISLIVSVACEAHEIQAGLLIAISLGMLGGYIFKQASEKAA